MANEFKSEHIYFAESPKDKMVFANFNFTEVSITFCIKLTSKKIIALPLLARDWNTNTERGYDTAKDSSRIYQQVMGCSDEEAQAQASKFQTITTEEFKRLLLQFDLFDQFIENVRFQNDRGFSNHIRQIFQVEI